jgi:flagellar basal body-associated protein FliL
MSRILSAVALFLMTYPLFAALREMDAANAPAETVNVIWVIVFCVVFVVAVAGFFAYIWLKDDKSE